MKKITAIFVVALVSLTIFFVRSFTKDFAYVTSNALSYCTADTDNDGTDELLVIAGRLKDKEYDGVFGSNLLILDYNGTTVGWHKILHSFDFKELKPSKVMAGDIDGDGLVEIGVCVYKKTEFHQEYAKRPFFYGLRNEKLVPIWLGSRLSRPFAEYILQDIDNDGVDNIVSIELTKTGEYTVSAYIWANFGIEKLGESMVYSNAENLRAVDENVVAVIAEKGDMEIDVYLRYNSILCQMEEESYE